MAILISSVLKGKFLKNIATLASGTAIAQIIALIFMPVLTRIYSQEAFGVFAAYSAMVGLLSSFVTLKYDTALVLPKDDRSAYALLKISNIATIILTLISFGFLFLPLSFLKEYSGMQVYIAIGTLLSVNYNNSALWNIRFKSFKVTTISKILQAISVLAIQYILFNYYEIQGLIIGNLIGVLVSGIYLVVFRKFDFNIYRSISLDEIKMQAKRYIDFPKYFTLSNFILSLSANLPILLFVNYLSYSEIGLYGIAMTLLIQPVVLISGSFKSVILSYMADKKNKKQKISLWFLKNIVLLFLISVLGCAVILIAGEEIVRFFLGESWAKSGIYLKMLLPTFLGMMIATPGIAAMRVFEMQKYGLYYSIFSLVVKYLALSALFYSKIEFSSLILIYSFVNLFLIIFNNLTIYSKIRTYDQLSAQIKS